jgi:hypothetical protein
MTKVSIELELTPEQVATAICEMDNENQAQILKYLAPRFFEWGVGGEFQIEAAFRELSSHDKQTIREFLEIALKSLEYVGG